MIEDKTMKSINDISMNKTGQLYLFLILVLIGGFGCNNILDVDDPIDVISDEQLNYEEQIPFLIKGIEARFASSLDIMTLQAGGLSDELFFDTDVQNATFGSYRNINQAMIPLDQGNGWSVIGELRFFSDDLLRRLETIDFEDQNLENEALYKANFYGGVARYFYGVYFGLEPEMGGGIIDAGSFIPSNDILLDAIDKLEVAETYALSPYHERLSNTLIARINLIIGDYVSAESAAVNGLVEGDEPLEAKYLAQSTFGGDLPNEWYYSAGNGRTQFVVDFRFHEYVVDNPQEAQRIPLNEVTGQSTNTTYYFQNKYPEQTSGIKFLKWQENELILAEIELNSDPNDPGNIALQHINRVRASHGIDPLSAVDIDVLIEERDKELFCEGHRLYDQRRFDIFHTHIVAVTAASGAGEALGPWRYFPIPDSERDSNENL